MPCLVKPRLLFKINIQGKHHFFSCPIQSLTFYGLSFKISNWDNEIMMHLVTNNIDLQQYKVKNLIKL